MSDVERLTAELKEMVECHPLWSNPLLARMAQGDLAPAHWGYLCGHHLRYSSQFTRFLGALMARLADPDHRAVVIENLIEEGGNGNVNAVHSTILRRLVTSKFGTDALTPSDGHISDDLAARYLELIQSSAPAAGAAVLAFGCEALVARLYQHFVDGMRKCGHRNADLEFF